MSQVTVRIPLEEAADLLEAPGRACLSFVVDGEPRVEPVSLVYENGRFLVGIGSLLEHPTDHEEVVLVVDDGVLFFELRGVYVRGIAKAVERDTDSEDWWLEVDPTRISSWDYGRMERTRESG